LLQYLIYLHGSNEISVDGNFSSVIADSLSTIFSQSKKKTNMNK